MRLTLAVLLVLTLAACAPAPQSGNGTAASDNAATSATVAPAPTPAPAPAATAAAATPDAAATLSRYHWQLSSATDASGKRIDALFVNADKPLQLDFDGQRLSVSNTCNRMNGGFTIADGKMEFSTFASTMMACPDPKLMAMDGAVGNLLTGSLAFVLDATGEHPALTLTTANGDKLVFTGNPTAETRFGSKGQIVFLEVAPQTKPCNHPLMKDAQCLEVREIHFNDQGIREGEPGPWRVLGQNIEGFTHQPGVRNVVRVKRFTVANPPADGSSVAYVLDLVVESHAKSDK